jgi:uncharacterized surface protein with fasciclin (FAS1) repeats
MKKTLLAIAACAVTLLAVSVGGPANAQEDTSNKTIVEIAQSNPDLSTLVTAVTKAKLADTLSGPGPFTVFAPTNAAFDALPAGTLDTLLADPTGKLADILKLHVISGAVDSKAATAAAGGTVDTLGGPISVELKGGKLLVGGATVVTADIKAKNGIIHVIDAVITKTASSGSGGQTPSSVQTGNSGIAASTTTNGAMYALLAGVALVGAGGSAFAIARARRD